MSQMDSMELYRDLIIEIPAIAKEYGAKNEIGKRLLTECIRLIKRSFLELSIGEIREAYRLWASGEIKVKGAEMYSGQFNASQLGKILGVYVVNRKKVLNIYLREEQRMRQEKEIMERDEVWKNRFEREFLNSIKSKRQSIDHWRKVPVWWYRPIVQRGWIVFKEGEAHEIFEEAKRMVGLEKKLDDTIGLTDQELARQIARRLSIYRKVIQVENWKPIEC